VGIRTCPISPGECDEGDDRIRARRARRSLYRKPVPATMCSLFSQIAFAFFTLLFEGCNSMRPTSALPRAGERVYGIAGRSESLEFDLLLVNL